MLMPDELSLMTEEEKLELVRKLSEAEEWQESFEQVYTHLMDDDSARVREEAIGALWYVADLQHMEPLMRRAEDDPSDEVRGRAVSVLGIYVYEGVVNMSEEEPRYQAVWRFLLDLANDPDESLFVRRMAIEALSFADDDEVNDLIEWAYEHASMEVRMSAIFAMGRSQQVRWHETILAEMDSEEFQLRQEAINAAGEARLAEATPRLRVLASHPNQEVRMAALWALSHTRGPGALETLELCLEGEDEEVRRVAREAIEEYRQEAEYEEGEEPSDYDEFYER